MLYNACFEYCRFAIKCAVGVRNNVWCDSLLLLSRVLQQTHCENPKRTKQERSVENTLVSTHNTADKRGFVVVALNS